MAIESGWAKAAKEADFHLDPNKQDKVDPRTLAELQSILDQIANASQEELGIIQQNIADAIGSDRTSLEDRTTVEKVNAVFKRSQELLGVNDSEKTPELPTLH